MGLQGEEVGIGKKDKFFVGGVVRQGVVYSRRKIDLKTGEETTQVQCIVD